MGFRLLLAVLCLSLMGGWANAQAKKTKKNQAKYETIDKKEIQLEETEYVKASPLNQPESSRMRERRQQLEMETEEQFIQQLEEARMEDERVRRQQIFERQLQARGTPLAEPYMESAPAPTPEPEYEPVPQVNEVSTTVIVNDPEPEAINYYISLGAGGINAQANNTPDVNGAGAIAAGIGLGNDFWFEGSFAYSFLESEQVFLADEDIDQFMLTVLPKYTFGMSNEVVTPMVGAALGYTRRLFNGGDNASNALDAGVTAGVDVALNRQVKIGFEARYMTNIDYEKDSAIDALDKALEEASTGRAVLSLEEFDYTLFMINAKMVF